MSFLDRLLGIFPESVEPEVRVTVLPIEMGLLPWGLLPGRGNGREAEPENVYEGRSQARVAVGGAPRGSVSWPAENRALRRGGLLDLARRRVIAWAR